MSKTGGLRSVEHRQNYCNNYISKAIQPKGDKPEEEQRTNDDAIIVQRRHAVWNARQVTSADRVPSPTNKRSPSALQPVNSI